MPYSNHHLPQPQVDTLMDISTTLADLTGSLELAGQIPPYLTRLLDVETLTLAIVRDGHDAAEPTLFLISSSLVAPTSEAADSLKQHVLAIYQQTKPLAPTGGPTLRSTLDYEEQTPAPPAPPQLSEMPVEDMAAFSRVTVLTRTIDPQHRMLLIAHQRATDAHFSTEFTCVLQLVADQLARQLNHLVAWHTRPEEFSEPLSLLTVREWVVLRALNTEAGEKQLADQLGLSPHTLHSHIKAIYRKMGVQGRLPLLAKVEAAQRELRRQNSSRSDRLADSPKLTSPVVAVG